MIAEAGQWHIAVGAGIRVTAPDGGDATPRAKMARALLAYLAAMPARSATRNSLIALLWSDRGKEQACASLRQCLFELRGGSPGLVDADGETVVLNAVVAIGCGGSCRRSTGSIRRSTTGWHRIARKQSRASLRRSRSERRCGAFGWWR